MINKPTSQQIKEYRDSHQISLQQAKADIMKQWRSEMLELIGIQLSIGSNGAALQNVLAYLIEIENSK